MIIGVRDDNKISMSGLLSATQAVVVNTGDCCPNRQYYLHTGLQGSGCKKSAGEETTRAAAPRCAPRCAHKKGHGGQEHRILRRIGNAAYLKKCVRAFAAVPVSRPPSERARGAALKANSPPGAAAARAEDAQCRASSQDHLFRTRRCARGV